ncbi:MAG: tetratricopeptide repeat protein [Archangiaceae bacterium]|nr:tetratricopeptide repeat protein [Archangiaceae bacterium]
MRSGLVVCCMFLAGAVRAEPRLLSEGKAAHVALEFERCISVLAEAAADPTLDGAQRAEVALYQGLCHYNLGHLDEAARCFDEAVRFNRAVTLPPDQSPKIIVALDAARGRLDPVSPPSPAPARPEAPAVVDVRASSAPPPPLIRPASWVLGGAAVLSLAAGLVGGSLASSSARQSATAYFVSDADAFARDAYLRRDVANVLFITASALAVATLIVQLWPRASP